MLKRTISLISILILSSLCYFAPSAFSAADQKNGKQPSTSSGQNGDEARPVLTVTPREIDLGSIKPGESVYGEFSLKNILPHKIEWSASCPEGWEASGGKAVKGVVSDEPNYLRLQLDIAERIDVPALEKGKIANFTTTMKLEGGGREIECRKDLKAGSYRNAVKFSSVGGQRTVYVGFRIHALQEKASINLNPQRIDLGMQSPGKIISRKIELNNRGREMLSWTVNAKKSKHPVAPAELPNERYISFHNEQLTEPGKYVVPDHLKDSLEVIGKWSEKNGYPMTKGGAGSLKFRFNGTGISAFLQSHTDAGHCLVYMDENPVTLPDVLSGEWEKKELVIAERLPDGPHVVTIVIKDGFLELEGVKVFGRDMMRGPKGWITVFPNSGTTTYETDYVNVKVDTSNLAPGYYGDQIVFRSNAGEETAEVFVNISADVTPKVIDVFLYSNDLDYLFTSDPQAEAKRLIQNGYIKEGIAFRLFAPQTPGTTSFYRWYNPTLHDHFYHYDPKGGGKKLTGYVYEGVLGNIATSRMTNTRELYRWFNPHTKRYYYSTNPKAATGIRRAYRFDGIAGYVR